MLYNNFITIYESLNFSLESEFDQFLRSGVFSFTDPSLIQKLEKIYSYGYFDQEEQLEIFTVFKHIFADLSKKLLAHDFTASKLTTQSTSTLASILELASIQEPLLELMGKVGLVAASVGRENLERSTKDDASLVTNADLEISTYFVEELERITGFPVVSEENIKEFSASKRKALGKYWLVDPIDGTKAFAAGTPNYCHMASFIEDGIATFSCIHLPELESEYIIGALGQGVYRGRLVSQLRVPGAKDFAFAKEAEVSTYVDQNISQALTEGEFKVSIEPLEEIKASKFLSLAELNKEANPQVEALTYLRVRGVRENKNTNSQELVIKTLEALEQAQALKLPLLREEQKLKEEQQAHKDHHAKGVTSTQLGILDLYLAPYYDYSFPSWKNASWKSSFVDDTTIARSSLLQDCAARLEAAFANYYQLNTSYQSKKAFFPYLEQSLALIIWLSFLDTIFRSSILLEDEFKPSLSEEYDYVDILALLSWACSTLHPSYVIYSSLEEGITMIEKDFLAPKETINPLFTQGYIIKNSVVLNDHYEERLDLTLPNFLDSLTFNVAHKELRYPYYLEVEHKRGLEQSSFPYLVPNMAVDFGAFNDRVLNCSKVYLSYQAFKPHQEGAKKALEAIIPPLKAEEPYTTSLKGDIAHHQEDLLAHDPSLRELVKEGKAKLSASGAFGSLEEQEALVNNQGCTEHKVFHLLYGGTRGYRLFGRYPLPLRRANCSKAFMHSAGVKTYYMLRDRATAYLQSSIMSEWDLAPAACFLQELGGALFDLSRQKFLSPQIFNRAEPLVPPMLLLTNREHLPFFINLAKLRCLETEEVTNLYFKNKGLDLEVDQLYRSVLG